MNTMEGLVINTGNHGQLSFDTGAKNKQWEKESLFSTCW